MNHTPGDRWKCRAREYRLTCPQFRAMRQSLIVSALSAVGISQDLPYTDFPLREFSFYCCYEGEIPVMLLKSEY